MPEMLSNNKAKNEWHYFSQRSAQYPVFCQKSVSGFSISAIVLLRQQLVLLVQPQLNVVRLRQVLAIAQTSSTADIQEGAKIPGHWTLWAQKIMSDISEDSLVICFKNRREWMHEMRRSQKRQTSPPVPHLANWTKHIHVVFDSGPLAPLCDNMTSSTKLEEHKVLHWHQEEDRATATANVCRKIWWNLDVRCGLR